MTRYARRADGRRGRWSWLGSGMSRAGAAVARNPIAVGGTTAFLVSFAFVSANALFYQPQMHPSAFVSTRGSVAAPAPDPQVERPTPAPRREVRQIVPAEEQAAAEPSPVSTGSVPPEPSGGDPTVRAVQTVLGDLGLYRGEVDGMTGPQTRAAIETYRRIVGLEAGTRIDAPLLRQLGLEEDEATAPGTAPMPLPRPSQDASEDEVQTASLDGDDPVVRRVQAGLKAFGNDGIEIDGIMGERTREAIREFQSLFGLPVTGAPDEEFLVKMREIGLIN